MEFHIALPSAPTALPRVETAVRAVDAAAVVDMDTEGSRVRVATSLDRAGLMALLSGIGITPAAQDVIQLPSICCGGCSG